ncbi:MAG: DNA polymerase III subunit beta [Parcubacteria group bacterium RIFCSPLOWO2_01_FULL_40_65]|nr:MAG: DNA polymerase III subunit beta [Parcubacteria group bacterium RIFCSPHIGHO2_01_FULL_40_30]OHB19376.1 MAG: DNA polymerase III subunit beta [Parcubacteria group bacterium RIFCSPHIGHO2_02_FULL_40_12]OHB21252.1 MAG: DNA polymerase III subunit beta [Parcubacteria group bacterium RIFCSPLOWO2_01_FULL_40_65]OHB23556.1 MAG: DNA polymerase III subunit beta [Parcubacteria group bacterium RIFCSPLOWO2_02_FULL_40_12]OHB24318.1 MAG: DNA polymerase III subunit beta [Parcubacteria group bacterium RIFCSP
MKFTVLTKNLQLGLNIVKNIVGKNLNLPVLNTVLLDSKNNKLNLSSTNLELGINYHLNANIENEGIIAIPAKIFSDFISNIKDEKIEFLLKDNTLNIQSVNFKTKLICFDPKDFPLIPKLKKDPVVILPSRLLKNSLTSVFDSVSLSQTRPELGGVFVNFNKTKIYFASTDSFRLTEKIINTNCNRQFSVIIPRNTVAELIRILSDYEKDVSINVEENQIQFSSDDFEIISRLIDGRYPDYQKVIPAKSLSHVLFKKEDLQNNIRLAGLFSSNINDIGLRVDKKEVVIFSKNSDRGEFNSRVKNNSGIQVEEPFEVLLNYSYLVDGLKNIFSEEVIFEYTGEGAPVILKPKDTDLNFTYLIMPLKT